MDDGPSSEPSDEPSQPDDFSSMSKEERAEKLNDTGTVY
jgi:hypothetical protein